MDGISSANPARLRKRGRGRPLTLTPAIADKIATAVKAGNYVETAAALHGVNRQTLFRWLRLGSGGKGSRQVYREFRQLIERAQAVSESADVARIGADAAWQARAWRLERKFPERWGLKVRIHVENELNAFLNRLEALLPPNLYELVLEAASATVSSAAALAATNGTGEVDVVPAEETVDAG